MNAAMPMFLELLRTLLLLAPATLLAYKFVHGDFVVKRWVGAFFAYLWQFQWRLMLFAGGIQLDLWAFETADASLLGVPTSVMLGASLLLGAVPTLLGAQYSKVALIITVLISDSLLIQTLLPFTHLSSHAPLLLALLSVMVIVPSLLLAHWTACATHIYWRSGLQNIIWAVLLLWLLPSVLFHLTADSWTPLFTRDWRTNSLYLLPMLFPAGLLINALYVFAKDGQGTGFPYDAPRDLVTTGVYHYITNPMQLGIVMMMALWGAILSSYLLMLTSPIALVLFIVFKDVCNGSCRIGTSDPRWKTYQDCTPKWLPYQLTPLKQTK